VTSVTGSSSSGRSGSGCFDWDGGGSSSTTGVWIAVKSRWRWYGGRRGGSVPVCLGGEEHLSSYDGVGWHVLWYDGST
jgi:hypothetical protein